MATTELQLNLLNGFVKAINKAYPQHFIPTLLSDYNHIITAILNDIDTGKYDLPEAADDE
jgi:hypothetical protein